MREFLGRLFRQTNGGPAVEFGIVFPIFLILILAIVDYGAAIFQFMAVSNAAQVGANYAVLNGYNPTTIKTKVNAATGIATANITVTELCGCPTGTSITKIDSTCTPALPRCAGNQPPGAYVTVTIRQPYSPVAPGISSPLTASSFVRVLQ
jgi:Flp pilus assembly protein TadG